MTENIPDKLRAKSNFLTCQELRLYGVWYDLSGHVEQEVFKTSHQQIFGELRWSSVHTLTCAHTYTLERFWIIKGIPVERVKITLPVTSFFYWDHISFVTE